MAKEFEIVSKIDLDAKQALETWEKFKSSTKELKVIDVKVKMSGLDDATKQMSNLLEMANKLKQSQGKIKSGNLGGANNSAMKDQIKTLKEYKDVYRTIEKLKSQKSKGLNDSSLESTNRQITELTSKLDTLKSKLSGTKMDAKRIEFINSQELANLAKTEKSLSDISSKAEKLQSSFKGIKFEHVDVGRLDSDISKIISQIEELQRRASTGVDLSIDLGNTYNQLNKLVSEMDKLKQVEDIKGKFESLEGSMKDAFGSEYAERLRGEIEQLESSVLQTDGSFDRLSGSIRGAMNSASADMSRMNNTMRQSNRFMSDFAGSFMMFTAGNVVGDGIVRAIRGITQSYLEMDKAITNVKKVADSNDTNSVSKLENIKNTAISTAKEVGKSSADVMNAMADTLQAGIGNMQTSMEVAKETMKFANVGELDQETASSAVNTMIKGFDINPVTKYKKEVNGTTKEVTGLTTSMDALNYASNQYGTSAQQLVDGMQNGGNVLGSYGVSLNDTVALITSGVEVLGNGNKVGNGLKSIGINLAGMKVNAKDGSLELNKTAKALSEIAGIDVYSDKSKGQVKDMVTVLDEVQEKWSTLREDEQLALSEGIAGKQQAAVFQAIMSNYSQFKKLQGEFSKDLHLGSMDAENEKYVDSISGKLNHLKEVWVSIGTTMVSSDFTKGLLDGAIKVSEAIDNIVQSLDKVGMLTPVITGIGLSFASMMKTMMAGGTAAPIMNSISRMNTQLKQSSTVMQGVKSVGVSAFKSVGGSIMSAGKFLGGFLLQGAAIAGITALVQICAKAWDNMAHGLENAEKEIKTTIEDLNASLNNNKSQLSFLEDTEKRYNELIEKKKEYSNIKPEDMTNDQIEDMRELKEITSELATMFPELVIGYDKEGSPLLLMADDMEKLKEKTKEQIELDQKLLEIQREKLADNARKQYQEGEFFGLGNGVKEKVDTNKALHDSLYTSLKSNEDSYTEAVTSGNDKRASKLKKTIDEQKKQLDVYYNDNLKLYQDYSQKEIEAQQSAFDQIQAIKGYSKLDEDATSGVQSFMDNLNWVNMDEGQYNKWLNGFGKVIDMAERGNPKLKEWSDSLEVANDKYSATGNVENYNKTLSELAKTISKDLGIDYETVFAGLETMGEPLTEAEQKMNSFLEAFGKTRYDLLNGDDMAMQLAEQFQGVNDVIDTMFNNQDYAFKANGTLSFDMMTDIANKDEIPDQIQELANQFAKGGVTKAESDMMLEIMMAIKSGDKEKIDQAITDVNSKLTEMGLEEHQIDIKTLFDETGTKKAKSDIDEIMNGDKTVNKEILIDTHGEEKAKQITEAIEVLDARPDVKKAVSAVVEGEDDLIFFSEIINNIPINTEYTNKFIVDNAEALSKMETYQEVVDFINSQPKEFRTKYGFDAEGVEETKEKVESVNKTIDEGNGKEFKVTTNNDDVLQSIEDIETLVKMSAEVEDGKYKLDIEANTEQAVNNLKSLETGLSTLSEQMGGMNKATISVETATAAKNISGLNRRIMDYNKMAASVKPLVFKAETAQPAKNISGLIAKVNQFNSLKAKTITFNAETAQAAKNISGLINKINSVPTGTKTITYKINTVGSPPKPPGGKSRPAPATVSPQPMSIASEINPRTPMVANESDILSPIDNAETPSTYGWNNPLETHKYGINHFVELENQLKKIASQLDIIDEKAKNAFGQEKIGYLNQQIELMKQQQRLQSNLASEMQKQQQSLKSFLGGKGVSFDGDGNISNYHNKLVNMNKELERLEEASKRASEASSNYKGDNESEKDRLSNASKSASDNLDNYKKSFDEIKKAMDEYLSLTFDDIPKAKEEWESLNNEIKEANDNLEKLNRQQKLFGHQNKVKELEYEYDKLSDKLSLINEKIENAYGRDKITLIEEQIALMKQQQDVQNSLVNSYKQMASVYRGDLSGYGFEFDINGDITNLDETLNKFKDHKDLEKVKDLVDEYIKIQRDELPGAILEWEKLSNSIKDAKKEQLEITKKIEDEITKKYKEDVEKRKKLIDEELKKRLDALDKQKKAYNDARAEADYKKDYEEQLEAVNDLQNKIDIASKDDSMSGKKKLEELLEKLKEEQEKLEDLVQDKIDKDVNSIFDQESDRLEDEAQAEKDRLDKDFSDEKIKELVKQALSTNVFEDIDGTMRNLQDVMIEFVDEYGEGMSAIGDLIKNEMIANLEIAKDTMKDISNIIKDLNLKEYGSNLGRMSMPNMSGSSSYSKGSNTNTTIQFNSELIRIDGNVDKDMLPVMEEMIKEAMNDVVDEIISYTR